MYFDARTKLYIQKYIETRNDEQKLLGHQQIDTTMQIALDYLYYALRNCKPKSSGTSIPQLTVPDIKNYSFEIVPIPRQEEITRILDKTEQVYKCKKSKLKNMIC